MESLPSPAGDIELQQLVSGENSDLKQAEEGESNGKTTRVAPKVELRRHLIFFFFLVDQGFLDVRQYCLPYRM